MRSTVIVVAFNPHPITAAEPKMESFGTVGTDWNSCFGTADAVRNKDPCPRNYHITTETCMSISM